MLTCDDNDVLEPRGDMTLSCWVKPDILSTGGNAIVMNRNDESTGKPWASYFLYLDFVSVKPKFMWAGETSTLPTYVTSSVQTVVGEWQHLVAVRTSGELKIYVNGAETTDPVHSGGPLPTGRMIDGGWGLRIGAENVSESGSVLKYHGSLDEICLAGVARSPGWVKLCYENQRAGQRFVRLVLRPETAVSLAD
jgi:hypothetical protein